MDRFEGGEEVQKKRILGYVIVIEGTGKGERERESEIDGNNRSQTLAREADSRQNCKKIQKMKDV